MAHTARSLRISHSRVVAFGMQRLPACEGSLCAYASRQAVAFPLRAAHPSKGTSSKTLSMPTVTSMQVIKESIGESGRDGEGGCNGEGGSGGEGEGGARGDGEAGYGADGGIPGQMRGCKCIGAAGGGSTGDNGKNLGDNGGSMGDNGSGGIVVGGVPTDWLVVTAMPAAEKMETTFAASLSGTE